MSVAADSPLTEPCSDCGSPSDTTSYAGHIRTPDGFERVDLPACTSCALANEQERAWKLSHHDPRDTLNGVVAWGVRVGE